MVVGPDRLGKRTGPIVEGHGAVRFTLDERMLRLRGLGHDHPDYGYKATGCRDGGTLDDRMVEILTVKKQLFAQVVDRTTHVDPTKVHLSLGDLVYMLTGTRDDSIDARDMDNAAVVRREQDRKAHARRTAHGHKKAVRSAADGFHDDGATAQTLEEHRWTTGPTSDAGS